MLSVLSVLSVCMCDRMSVTACVFRACMAHVLGMCTGCVYRVPTTGRAQGAYVYVVCMGCVKGVDTAWTGCVQGLDRACLVLHLGWHMCGMRKSGE